MKQLLSILFITLTVSLYSQQIYAPSQAYNVSISNITTNSFKISWTPPSCYGVLVVVKPAANSISAPVSNSVGSYVANSSYNGGSNLGNFNYVVYKGSGTSVTVTNLGSDYNFEVIVYAYNYGCLNYITGFGCIGLPGYLINSSTSTNNKETHYTLATQPTAAPTISLVGTAATTATLSFNGTSSYNIINMYATASSSYNAPIDGNYYTPSSVFGSGAQIGGAGTNNFSVYSSTANGTVNVSNLAPATTYYGIAFSYNGSGSSTNNSFNYNPTYAYVYFSTYNTPPTLNALSAASVSLCVSPGTQTVSLSGIGKGSALETQTLTISAYSSNTALIPAPVINYTNPNSTGTLVYTPVAGQYGVAVIGVTVNDGGPNNNTVLKTFTVVVKPKPDPAGTITTATTTLCQIKNGVTFSVPSILNTTNYNWSLPSGATIVSGSNTNSITVNFNTTATSHNVSVYGSNANGCGNGTTSPSLLVNFDKEPTTSVAGPNQSICNNLTALAANTVAVGTATWSYCSSGLFNINPASAPNANLTVLDNATVTAVWTVTNGVCPASSSTVVVTNIKGSGSCNPYAEFVASSTEMCVNSSVTFNNTSVAALGVNTYTWNFGAGANPATSTSTAAAITVTYSTVGAKTVTLSMNTGGPGLLTMVKTNYINVITAPAAPSSIFGNSPICQGKMGESYSINLVTNATGYNWTFPTDVFLNTGSNTNAITANFSTTATSGNIGVSATNACGTSTVTTFSVTVNPLPNAASSISGNVTVCQGQNGVVYTANNLNNGLSYTWQTPFGTSIASGLNTKTLTLNYDNSSLTGIISVYATNACGDGPTTTNTITVNPLPVAAGTITGTSLNETCPLSLNINYSVTPIVNATNYDWIYPAGYTLTSGSNTNSIFLDASFNSVDGMIKIVGKNACGNGDSASLIVNINELPTQELCMVTVNDLSTKNEIIWEKNGSTNIDSFKIYRVKTASIDTLVGTVDYADISKFTDTTNANPNITQYAYKIAAVDMCGNIGPKSSAHTTIHCSYTWGVNGDMHIAWNDYVGATVDYYQIWKNADNQGWVSTATLSPVSTTYDDPTSFLTYTTVSYYVDVIWQNSCDYNLLKTMQSIVSTTRSNTKDFLVPISTKLREQGAFLNSVKLFPNPSKDTFTIELEEEVNSLEVEIYNQLGSIVKTKQLSSTSKAAIDMSDLSVGIYSVVIKTEFGSVTKRMTKL